MFEMLQKYVVVTASILSTICLGWCVMQAIRELRFNIRKWRGNKMVARARTRGPVVCYNEVGKTSAICLKKDFHVDGKYLPWQSVQEVRVRPTFTFRDDEIRAKVNVDCTREQAREMIDTLVAQATGYTKNQVDKANFEKAQKLLIVKDPRLFVPFSKELSEEEGKRQLDFYGSTPSFDEVRDYILNSIN